MLDYKGSQESHVLRGLIRILVFVIAAELTVRSVRQWLEGAVFFNHFFWRWVMVNSTFKFTKNTFATEHDSG